jgi:hypothetical protein
MTTCPYCEQDALSKCHINGVESECVLCCECDTVWLQEEKIEYGTGKNFEIFMEGRGLAPDWKAIQLEAKMNG